MAASEELVRFLWRHRVTFPGYKEGRASRIADLEYVLDAVERERLAEEDDFITECRDFTRRLQDVGKCSRCSLRFKCWTNKYEV